MSSYAAWRKQIFPRSWATKLGLGTHFSVRWWHKAEVNCRRVIRPLCIIKRTCACALLRGADLVTNPDREPR